MSDWSRWSNKRDMTSSFSGFLSEAGQFMSGDPKEIAKQNGWMPDNFGWYRDGSGQVVARSVGGKMVVYDGNGNTNLPSQTDMGNPAVTAGQKPAERARSMGLQSNGKGGYTDESGQVVARTVNGELVFYDSNGGAVSDGAGGKDMVMSQPSWVDPDTGLIMVPPAQPETPEELAATPDPLPATPPMGYDKFIKDRHKKMKEMAKQAPPEPEQPEMPEMGMEPPQMEGYLKFMNKFSQLEEDRIEKQQKYLDDFKESLGQGGLDPRSLVKTAVQNARQGQQLNLGKRPGSGSKPEMSANMNQSPADQLRSAASQQWQRHVDEKKPRRATQESLMRDRFTPFANALEGMEDGDAKTQFNGSMLRALQYGEYNNNATQLMSGPEVRGTAGRLKSIREGYQADEQGRFDIDKAEEFVQSSKTLKGQIPEDIIDLAFNALPERIQKRFGGGGDLKKDKAGQRQGFGMYCEQGGNCGYSGMPLDLESFAMEHYVDNSRVQNGNATEDEASFINDPSRSQMWINKAPNAQKSARTPVEFADIVEKLNEYGDDYFDFQDNEVVPSKGNLKNEELGLLQGIVDRSGETPKLFDDIDGDKLSSIKDAITSMYDGKKSTLMSQLTEKYDPGGLGQLGDKTAERQLADGTITDADMEIRNLVRGLATQIKSLGPGFGRNAVKSLGLTRGVRQSLRPRTAGMGHDSIYEGFVRSLSRLPADQRQDKMDMWQKAMGTAGKRGVEMAESGQRGLRDSDIGSEVKGIFSRMAREGGLFDEQSQTDHPLLKKFLSGDITEAFGEEGEESENPMDMILQILQKLQSLQSLKQEE